MATRTNPGRKPRKRKTYELTLKRRSRRKRAFILYRKAILEGHIRGEHNTGRLCLHVFNGVRCKVYALPDGSVRIVGL